MMSLVSNCVFTRNRLIAHAAIALSFLVATSATTSVPAQEMELPVSIQVPLFLKVISFDRLRNQLPDAMIVVGIAYQSGYRTSSNTRDEVDRSLRAANDRRIKVVIIDLDRDDLGKELQEHKITLLYVSPLRSYSIADIASAAVAVRAMTVTGVPQYVEQGLAVGARLQGDRPKLMVNLPASRRGGANFSAELLKLAQVLE